MSAGDDPTSTWTGRSGRCCRTRSSQAWLKQDTITWWGRIPASAIFAKVMSTVKGVGVCAVILEFQVHLPVQGLGQFQALGQGGDLF